MRITEKGQVTIPKRFRDRYGLLPDTEVEFEAGEHGVYVRPSKNARDELRERLKQATGAATVPITTDEILRLTRGDE